MRKVPIVRFVDTQVLSGFFKSNTRLPTNIKISSLTAIEFLRTQPPGNAKPRYYVVHPGRIVGRISATNPSSTFLDMPKRHIGKEGAHHTDKLTIDFRNQFPPYREYGNFAISKVINESCIELYKLCISHLPKEKRKGLVSRLEYIIRNEVECCAADEAILEIGLALFSAFVKRFTCKNDIRNSVNDILILATAIKWNARLTTRDMLLRNFATEYLGVTCSMNDDCATFEFSQSTTRVRHKTRESKGYKNRGWSYICSRNSRD